MLYIIENEIICVADSLSGCLPALQRLIQFPNISKHIQKLIRRSMRDDNIPIWNVIEMPESELKKGAFWLSLGEDADCTFYSLRLKLSDDIRIQAYQIDIDSHNYNFDYSANSGSNMSNKRRRNDDDDM